jgi:hypothetical protein
VPPFVVIRKSLRDWLGDEACGARIKAFDVGNGRRSKSR